MTDEQRDPLSKINQETVERYSTRLNEHGESVETLGWGSRTQQRYRFKQYLEFHTFSDKNVLDVGCGFGDFLTYLQEESEAPSSYTGIDVNSDFIEIARSNHPDETFIAGDPLTMDETIEVDTIVMSGVLNYKQSEIDNFVYTKKFLQTLFDWTQETLIIDMLSAIRDSDYPKEDFVYYYEPTDILSLALELTPHVALKHDFKSIPQRELLLKLRHSPCE